jgi:hypothetical protein
VRSWWFLVGWSATGATLFTLLVGCHSRGQGQSASAAPSVTSAAPSAGPLAIASTTMDTPQPPLSLDEARSLGRVLGHYLKIAPLAEVPSDLVSMLRTQVVGDPLETADGLMIPPWRFGRRTERGLELIWTIDLGHESGTRRWSSRSRSSHPRDGRSRASLPPTRTGVAHRIREARFPAYHGECARNSTALPSFGSAQRSVVNCVSADAEAGSVSTRSVSGAAGASVAGREALSR